MFGDYSNSCFSTDIKNDELSKSSILRILKFSNQNFVMNQLLKINSRNTAKHRMNLKYIHTQTDLVNLMKRENII